MCGIAGYIGPRPIPEGRQNNCLSLMKQRGPDANGRSTSRTSNGGFVHLLHTRLSIIDLDERAKQPFGFEQDVLSFNGEIYNYLEIRHGLEARGEIFSTQSDTEVLACQLARNGIQGVSACEGMWGFAWYDRHQNLYLCRDRFGEKPLYYYEDTTGLYFGSEPKFIFALLGRHLTVNLAQINRYLVNGYKSLYKDGATFFEGLREVNCGSYLMCDGRSPAREIKYWQPEFIERDENMTYEQAVAGTREALIRSVELRLRSDVPIAFCLSGGIDSNALIAIAKKELGYDVHGFTIMNTDERYEEADLVNLAVKELSLRHTPIFVN